MADWTFGIQDENLQKTVDEARAKGAQVVVLLSHNGMDVDLKLASRVSGIDAILGGHTHDGVPVPALVQNRGGRTLVTNAGSQRQVPRACSTSTCASGRVAGLPLPPAAGVRQPAAGRSRDGRRTSTSVRAPFEAKLAETLAVTEGLLYRRGNFNGSWDQLVIDALMEVKGAEIAFSPGFRWGTTLLPGQPITRERDDGPARDHLPVRRP